MADNFKATINGKLQAIDGCVIIIPGQDTSTILTDPDDPEGPGYYGKKTHRINLRALPDISDSKQAVYNNEGIIGRSAPLYTYSHSGDRNINMQLHFFVTQENCGSTPSRELLSGGCGQCPNCNLKSLRWIQSACYPREDLNAPFKPPPICKIKCGDLFTKGNRPLCAVLQSYSVRFPTEVAWDTDTGCPYRFDVDTSWLVVYTTQDLPFQNHIFTSGR